MRSIEKTRAELNQKHQTFEKLIKEIVSEAMTDRLEELQAAAEEVADTAIAAMRQVGTLTNALARMAGTNPDELTSDLTTRLLADSQSLINQAGTGLSRLKSTWTMQLSLQLPHDWIC